MSNEETFAPAYNDVFPMTIKKWAVLSIAFTILHEQIYILFFTQHCNPKYKPHNFGIIHCPEVARSVLCPQSEIWFISHCPESEIWFISHSVGGERILFISHSPQSVIWFISHSPQSEFS